MISLRQIKKDITTLLNSQFKGVAVHWDNIDKPKAPYFYVEISPILNTFDEVVSVRTIEVDIQYLPPYDDMERINRMEVWDMADSLDKAIRPVLKVDDRYITIQHAEMTFTGDILHYIFTLQFADAIKLDTSEYELMAELEIDINKRSSN